MKLTIEFSEETGEKIMSDAYAVIISPEEVVQSIVQNFYFGIALSAWRHENMPWHLVPERGNWIVVDPNGYLYWSVEKPKVAVGGNHWSTSNPVLGEKYIHQRVDIPLGIDWRILIYFRTP